MLRSSLLLGFATLSCGTPAQPLRYTEAELIVDRVDAGYLGEPTLIAGLVADGRFTALEEGAELPILHGFQGGRWVHIALRVTGLRKRGRVVMELRGVGTASYDIKLTRRGELLEIFDLPIAVGRQPRLDDAEVDALAGTAVHLTVDYTAGTNSVGVQHDLTLSLASH